MSAPHLALRIAALLAAAWVPKSAALSFLETVQVGAAKTGARDVPDLLANINSNIETTQDSFAKTEQDCDADGANLDAIINQTNGEMTLYRAQGTSASSDHTRAESTISMLDTTAIAFQNESNQRKTACENQSTSLQNSILTMKDDAKVLVGIVRKLKDSNNPSFFQRGVDVHVLKQLQSQDLFRKFVKEVVCGNGTEDAEDVVSNATNASQTPRRGVKLLRAEKVGSRASLLPSFKEAVSEITADIARFEQHKSSLDDECKAEIENSKSQIGNLRKRQDAWQTALAEATDAKIKAAEGEKLEQGKLKELTAQMGEFETTCNDEKAELNASLEHLVGIRKDLGKHSEAPKFIEDCKASGWEASACSKECVSTAMEEHGSKTLTRTIKTAATLGAGCGVMSLTVACGTTRCAIDCVQSKWSEWSACSSQCGGGVRERLRSIKNMSRFGGEACGPASETETCNTQDCSKDCVLAPWSIVSNMKCSKTCGGGVKVASRAVLTQSLGNGTCPAEDSAERRVTVPCNKMECPPADSQHHEASSHEMEHDEMSSHELE